MNPSSHTQHERDAETGLDYRGARFYDAEVGRFLSVDPLAVKYPSLNPFSYLGGMVSMAVDPDGMEIVIGAGDERAQRAAKHMTMTQIGRKTYRKLDRDKNTVVFIGAARVNKVGTSAGTKELKWNDSAESFGSTTLSDNLASKYFQENDRMAENFHNGKVKVFEVALHASSKDSPEMEDAESIFHELVMHVLNNIGSEEQDHLAGGLKLTTDKDGDFIRYAIKEGSNAHTFRKQMLSVAIGLDNMYSESLRSKWTKGVISEAAWNRLDYTHTENELNNAIKND